MILNALFNQIGFQHSDISNTPVSFTDRKGSRRAMLAILIPAAGLSRRMNGADKLLGLVDGQPIICRVAKRALSTGCQVIIALPATDIARHDALGGLTQNPNLTLVHVQDPALGMSHSLRTLVQACAPSITAAMILPADMPLLSEDDLAKMLAAWHTAPEMIHRATSDDGDHGHPVIFPRSMFQDLCGLQGDRGARSVLKAHASAITYVSLPDNHAILDLDTPEDWADWRSRHV